MKTKLIIYLPIILLFGFSFQSCEKEDIETKPEFSLDQPDQISDEIYEIYSFVINEIYSFEKIVIVQASKTDLSLKHSYNWDYLIENYQTLDTSLVQIYSDLNETSVNFGEQFRSDTKDIILISSDELSYIFDNGGWEEFYNDYENSYGYIRFSRIAINEDNTQAIFEIDHYYGNVGGNGSIVFLEKLDDNWSIKEVIPTWIS